MKPWLETTVALVCLMAGCRTDPNIVLLERENRELEDAIYELQACLDQYQEELEACRQSNLALEKKLAGEAGDSGDVERSRPMGERPPLIPSPKGPAQVPGSPRPPARKPAPAPVQPEDLVPPKIELPGDPLPEGQLPKGFEPSGTGVSPQSEPGFPSPASSPTPNRAAQARSADNTQVAAIVLLPEQTGGQTPDRRGPDDGLRIVIEPRDVHGRPCPAPGPISVVALDPAIAGEAARVARWDFAAEEIAGLISRDAICLEMLWPQSPPLHDKLRLYVRYTTDDGRKLQADCPIKVTGAQNADRWAPALLPPAVSEAEQPTPAGRNIEPNKTAVHPVPRADQHGQLQSAAEPLPMAQRPVWSPHRR